jgi:hypothetical protein
MFKSINHYVSKETIIILTITQRNNSLLSFLLILLFNGKTMNGVATKDKLAENNIKLVF